MVAGGVPKTGDSDTSLSRRLTGLVDKLGRADRRLNLAANRRHLKRLQEQSGLADFWQRPGAANLMQQQIRLVKKLAPWDELISAAQELQELLALGDSSLWPELAQRLTQVEKRLDELKSHLQFGGSYDDYSAALSIHAGAGGTDAQDWAAMLRRMYVRWAQQNGLKATLVTESVGEEAGLKSVSIQVDGDYAYGLLKSEHGVHRLVRLSPFNSDHLRQTSFAKVEVVPLITAPEQLELPATDLKIDVFRSGGHGGQSVNTTDSAVRVTHLPTGITVVIQNERSQLQNKETAMAILRGKIAQLQIEQHTSALNQLKGPTQSAEWGNQIRSYVLHPYKQVKDLRTGYETSDVETVLDGNLAAFTTAYLDKLPPDDGA